MKTATITDEVSSLLPEELINYLWSLALAKQYSNIEKHIFKIDSKQLKTNNELHIQYDRKNIRSWSKLFLKVSIDCMIQVINKVPE